MFTPPLRDLTDPDASWGHDFIDFCALIGWPLDPWQRWLAVHLGELFPDGSPRYRKAIVLVARQNGKTLFCRLLILYWMFIERVPETLATSTDRAAAKRSWLKVIEMARRIPLLAEHLARRHTALQIGEEDFWNELGSHYRFAAPTRRAGRGDTINRALLDELREHKHRDTWDAVIPAMGAVADALVVCISNEGDVGSVVLHEEYDAALGYVETGEGDPSTFLAAWSAPAGADPTDLDALAYANPSIGHRIRPEALLGEAMTAKRTGGETLLRFRIERMCQRVALIDTAIDMEKWATLAGPGVDLAQHRTRVALCLDVSLDARHAVLVAAAVLDGIAHVEVVDAWTDMAQLRADLIPLVTRIRPAAFGWFPAGPAAAIASNLADQRRVWPPRRVTVEAIRGDVTACCMGLATEVQVGQIRHPDDPLLTAHLTAAGKLPRGDQWVFMRRGAGPVNGAYATAGAVWLARTLPPAPPPLTIA